MPSFNPKGGAARLAQLMAANLEVPRSFDIKAEDRSADVYVYDGIGGWFGIEAEQFARTLSGLDVDTINLYVNSPGGDVFDARAMMAALRRNKAKVVAHIDGLAASAATFLVMAADEVHMAQGARFMIHDGWSLQIGNKHDMRETGDLLDGIDNDIAADYSKKTGKEKDELLALMDAETWMSADEALEMGFVDSIFDPAEPVENRYNLDAYDNAPEDFPKADIATEADRDFVPPPESPAYEFDIEDLAERIAAKLIDNRHIEGGDPKFAAGGIITTDVQIADQRASGGDVTISTEQEDGKEIIRADIQENSSEPVARSMASRERRLKLLERELSL